MSEVTLSAAAQGALLAYLKGRTLAEALAATETRLLREDHVLGWDGPVVYLLIDPAGHVVYVGQSIDWQTRAGLHDERWGGVAKRAQVIRVPDDVNRLHLENALIRILQPPLNRAGTRHGGLPYGANVPAALAERLADKQPLFPDAPPPEAWPSAERRIAYLIEDMAAGRSSVRLSGPIWPPREPLPAPDRKAS